MKKLLIALLIMAFVLTSCQEGQILKLMEKMGNNVSGNIVPVITVTTNSTVTSDNADDSTKELVSQLNNFLGKEEKPIVTGLDDQTKETLTELVGKKDSPEGKKAIEELHNKKYEGSEAEKEAVNNTVDIYKEVLDKAKEKIGETALDSEVGQVLENCTEFFDSLSEKAGGDGLSEADVLAISSLSDAFSSVLTVEVPLGEGEESTTIVDALANDKMDAVTENIGNEDAINNIITNALPEVNSSLDIIDALGYELGSLTDILAGIAF